MILYQLHDHICREILEQDPRACQLLRQPGGRRLPRVDPAPGATRDWRELMREATGEDLSSRAMLEYFAPLQAWLEKQNRGRTVGF